MSLNAIEGVVENGKIRLREEVALPENATVYVIVTDWRQDRTVRLKTPRLAVPRQAAEFTKQVTELPRDAGL